MNLSGAASEFLQATGFAHIAGGQALMIVIACLSPSHSYCGPGPYFVLWKAGDREVTHTSRKAILFLTSCQSGNYFFQPSKPLGCSFCLTSEQT